MLLDEHLSPALVPGLVARGIDVAALREWQGGSYLEAPDDVILRAALEDGRTLVTYDQRTIPPLIKQWSEAGGNHGGIVFIDHRTLLPNDLGGLVRALTQLDEQQGPLDWTNRVVFLQRSQD